VGERDIWVRFFLCRDKPELKTNMKEWEKDREWAHAQQKDRKVDVSFCRLVTGTVIVSKTE